VFNLVEQAQVYIILILKTLSVLSLSLLLSQEDLCILVLKVMLISELVPNSLLILSVKFGLLEVEPLLISQNVNYLVVKLLLLGELMLLVLDGPLLYLIPVLGLLLLPFQTVD